MKRRVLVLFIVAGLCAASVQAATIEGVATVRAKSNAATVIYLEARDPQPQTRPAPQVTMDQKDLAFVPGILPVVRGTTVDFRNSDDVEHNVFSPSDAAHQFDLGTYRRGQSRTVVFDQVGEVLVLCNIHMEMAARILVLRDPYFARTAADGSFRIDDVPPGTYTLRIWSEDWLPNEQTVEVTKSGTVTVNVAVP